ncbi:MAG TPA: hypothetical protein VFO19_20915 [Vicinamibacterales bacterium]|nr:hypothetical protein [Vicinamibacterales bacterium]
MSDDNRRVLHRRVERGVRETSARRLNPERVEKRRQHPRDRHRQVETSVRADQNRLTDERREADIGQRSRPLGDVTRAHALACRDPCDPFEPWIDDEQPRGVRIWERPVEPRVHHRKHGGRQRETQRDDGNHRSGVHGRPPKTANDSSDLG